MKENQLIMQNKIDRLISEMGKSAFLKLLHFMVDIMEDDHEIKVLMVRRFLDLFLEFEEIIQYTYEGTVKKKGTFVTNLSIVLWQEELAEKTILIVDDIRLHGRALDKIGTFLTEQCGCAEENITLRVFADNQDAVKVESRFLEQTEIKERVDENRWKKISSGIINSFYISGQPYISHLPYCEIPFEEAVAQALEHFVRSGKAEEITTEIQKYYGMRVYLYFADFDPGKKTGCRLPFVEQNLIRIYIYDRLEKIIVVPYAFLKPFSYEGLDSFCCVLSDAGLVSGKYRSESSDCKKEIIENKYLEKYRYSLATYVTSLLLGERFLEGLEIKGISWNERIEQYNLGYHLDIKAQDQEALIGKLRIGVENGFAADIGEAVQLPKINEIQEILEETKKIRIREESSESFIESYTKRSGLLDEKLAEEKKKRMPGIEYIRLLQNLPDKTIQDVWKAIIRIIDSGRGTLSASVNKINQKFFINSLLYAGEQNFTGNERNLIYFIYPLLEYECRLQDSSFSEQFCEVDIYKEKERMVSFIFDCMPDLRDKVDTEELKTLTEKSIQESGMDYYMGRYPVYKEDPKLQEILIRAESFGKEQPYR